jgi:thymidylate synthase
MLAKCHGLQPHRLVVTVGDAHIYKNHIAQTREMIRREPRPLPKLVMSDAVEGGSVLDVREEHVHLEGYEPWPALHGQVAV